MNRGGPSTVERGPYGDVLILRGPWHDGLLEEFDCESVGSIVLNYAKGWQGENIEFVRHFPHLQAVDITSYEKVDISALERLSDLRSLGLSLFNKEPLDFGAFPQLEDCSLIWHAGYRNLTQCSNLRRLFMSGWRSKDLSDCVHWPRLLELTVASGSLISLTGLEFCAGLAFVGLFLNRKLADVGALSMLEGLTWVECSHCSQVSSISPLSSSQNLEHINLVDMGKIESLSPLFDKSRLRVLMLYGGTNILDGRLCPLLELPKLESVAFSDRSHYDCAASEFPHRLPDPVSFDWRAHEAGS